MTRPCPYVDVCLIVNDKEYELKCVGIWTMCYINFSKYIKQLYNEDVDCNENNTVVAWYNERLLQPWVDEITRLKDD